VARWAGLCLLNVVLAAAAFVLAPADVGTTADRLGYEYVGEHLLAPDCPHSIFCYRVLVPAMLAHGPLPEVARWRAFAAAANTATGVALGAVALAAGGGWLGAVLATVLFQGSFGAAFTVFDPFTPDAAVYLIAALLALCWYADRSRVALVLGVLGIFAKETIALVLVGLALAAGLGGGRRADWMRVAVVTTLAVVGFHIAMNVLAGWSEQGSASANLFGGAWLGRWLSDPTLTPASRAFYLFIPFAFAWVYAFAGAFSAPWRLKLLCLGSLVLVAVVYVQTPERALSTMSFAVVPTAALFLSRVPPALALPAAATNALLTARVGLSSALLPPVGYLMLAAGAAAAVTILCRLIAVRTGPSSLVGSSRVISTR
jgi:hypothetical protein